MTFQEMMDFVRTHCDADTDDAPDGNLKQYAKMAYNSILARQYAWPHLTANYGVVTSAGVSDYLFTTVTGGTIDRVTSVVDQSNLGWTLMYMTRSDADMFFGSPSAPFGVNATAYTVEGSTIVFYPTPASTKSYVVRGFRAAASWPTTAGSEPDLPRMFDDAICWYMIAQYYASQEDLEISNMYLMEYRQMVDEYVSNTSMKNILGRPQRMGGNNAAYAPRFLERVRGALE